MDEPAEVQKGMESYETVYKSQIGVSIICILQGGVKGLFIFTPILGISNLFIPKTLMTHMLEDVSSIKCMVIGKPLKKESHLGSRYAHIYIYIYLDLPKGAGHG